MLEDPLGGPLETFTHSAVPSPDRRFLFTADELPGHWVLAWDLSTIGACSPGTYQNCGIPAPCPCINLVARFQVLQPTSFLVAPHELAAQGDLLYVSYYTEGVRVLDVSNPVADGMPEVAHFDTWFGPGFDPGQGSNFFGVWGVTPAGPFVLAGDMNSGLYILEPFPSYFPAPIVEGPAYDVPPNASDGDSWAAGDFDGDGDLDAVGAAPGLAVYLNQGDSRFVRGPFVPACPAPGPGTGPLGGTIHAVAPGDFDGDGDADLAVAFEETCLLPPCTGTFHVRILLADGAGGFTCLDPVLTLGPCQRASLVAGMFDADDRRLDLAVAACGELRIFAQTSPLTFTPIQAIPASIWALAAGDYDGDGRTDLATTDNAAWAIVRRQSPPGDFSTICRAFGPGAPSFLNQPQAIAFGPLDADAKADLAIASIGSDTLTAVRSDGCAPASERVTVLDLAGNEATDVAIGRFNYQDECGDIVASRNSPRKITLFKQDAPCSASLSFGAGTDWFGGRRLLAADFNRDGKPDVATADLRGFVLEHGLGNADLRGSLTTSPNTGNPSAIVTGYFNDDGHLDAIVVGTEAAPLELFLGDGLGGFTRSTSVCPGAVFSAPVDVIGADFDDDGDLDFAVANGANDTVQVCLNDGVGTFAPRPPLPATVTGLAAIAAGKLRSTSRFPDLVVAGGASKTVVRFFGLGTGDFDPLTRQTLFTTGAPIDLTLATLNAGSSLDIAVAETAPSSVSVFSNDGNGLFSPLSTRSLAPALATSLAAGDLDHDGDPDLVTGNYGGDLTELFNDGNGSFPAIFSVTVGDDLGAEESYPTRRQVIVLDVDSDAWPEILAKNPDSVALLPRDEAGNLTTTPYLFRSQRGGNLAAGDFDNDFAPDLITSNAEVLPNRGGYFPMGDCLPTARNPVAVRALDFLENLDGKVDLVTLGRTSHKLEQFRGDGTATFTPAQSIALVPAPASDFVAMDARPSSPTEQLLVVVDRGARRLLRSLAAGNGFGPAQALTIDAAGAFVPHFARLANFDDPGTSIGNDVAVLGVHDTLGLQLRVYFDVDQSASPTHVDFNLPGERADELTVGQLDTSDSYLDIAVSLDRASPVASDSVIVVRRDPVNPPARNFLVPVETVLGVALQPRGLLFDLFDADTEPELVVVVEGPPSRALVLHRTGTPGQLTIVQTVSGLSPGAFTAAAGSIDHGLVFNPPRKDFLVLHRDQSEHPATALLTVIPGNDAGPPNIFNPSFTRWLVLGSFDQPAIAVGDFVADPSLTPADGIAIVNGGRDSLCIFQPR